jgi:DNA-binding XRE family transcriptional regulator/predicted RNase H-like HicB family nuclease
MEYVAELGKEGKRTLIHFPDCPGCDTFADTSAGEEVTTVAREALEAWLAAHLVGGEAPPRPTMPLVHSAKTRPIRVTASLAIALQLRWRRQELGLSQAQLGKLLGVSRQQAASLEDPDANLRLSSIERVASVLHLELDVALHPMSA